MTDAPDDLVEELREMAQMMTAHAPDLTVRTLPARAAAELTRLREHVAELERENARLNAASSVAHDLWNSWSRKCAEAEADLDALCAENEGLRRDAERFRVLVFSARRAMDQRDGIMWHAAPIHDPQWVGLLAAIDAARAGSKS